METPSVDELREPITFNVANEIVTRGEIATSISSFNVYAYETDDVSNVIIDNAHFTKNEAGVWSTDVMFYWTGNEITFCAYIPSDNFTQSGTTLTYTMPTDVTAQQDLMVAKDAKATGSVSFSFARIMSLVKFSVKGDGADVESVTISGLKDAGSYDMATAAWDLGDVSTSVFEAGIGAADETTGQITNSTGYLMVLPQTVAQLQITAENSNEKSKDYDLSDVVWAAGNLYNYTIDTDGIDPEDSTSDDTSTMDLMTSTNDYLTKDASNCYIINPSNSQRVYHIPVEGRINTYWTDYDLIEENQINDEATRDGIYAEQLWSDCGINAEGGSDELTVGLAVKDGVKIMQVVVPADYSTKGNAVYAVKNSEGVILWSWHLWVTDYAPTAKFMNRFVGQTEPSGVTGASIAGTLVYQFGRKDPFVSSSTSDYDYGADCYASISESINNPTVLYGKVTGSTAGYYRYWAYSSATSGYEDSGMPYTTNGTNIIWGDKKTDADTNDDAKSIFDPSPYGYRVPYSAPTSTAGTTYNYNSDLYGFSYANVSAGWYTITVGGSYSLYYTTDIISMHYNSFDAQADEVDFWTSRYTYSSSISSLTGFNLFQGYDGSLGRVICTGSAHDLVPVFPIKM